MVEGVFFQVLGILSCCPTCAVPTCAAQLLALPNLCCPTCAAFTYFPFLSLLFFISDSLSYFSISLSLSLSPSFFLSLSFSLSLCPPSSPLSPFLSLEVYHASTPSPHALVIVNGALDKVRDGYYPAFAFPQLAKCAKRFYKDFDAVFYLRPVSDKVRQRK